MKRKRKKEKQIYGTNAYGKKRTETGANQKNKTLFSIPSQHHAQLQGYYYALTCSRQSANRWQENEAIGRRRLLWSTILNANHVLPCHAQIDSHSFLSVRMKHPEIDRIR
jgi:hypothetical protein